MVLNTVTHLYLLISFHLKSQNVEIHNFIKRLSGYFQFSVGFNSEDQPSYF